MHVLFVSACEKRALKRTRRILDRYANRLGSKVWSTPITTEGLEEIKKLLRKSATRQTSVACYKNDGIQKMELAWIIGNRNGFNSRGFASCATTAKKTDRIVPTEWMKVCQILASTAGLLHDIGKFNNDFQKKLSSKVPVSDIVRHEWISTFVLKKMLSGKNLEQAFQDISQMLLKDFEKMDPFNNVLSSPFDVLQYLVATHHRLFETDSGRLYSSNHVRNSGQKYQTSFKFFPSEKTSTLVAKKIKRLENIQPPSLNPDLYWQAVALISRVGLIFADHIVSAEQVEHSGEVYANTTRNRRKNQELNWHLEEVSKETGQMVYRMLTFSPPALSRETVDRIVAPADGRFVWQNVAYDALKKAKEENNIPYCVFNVAGTGSGKTRMNAKAVCALSEENSVRFHVGMNLKSLTLQTGDVYSRDVGIPKDEMSCVIGDDMAKRMDEYRKSLIDDDENDPQADYAVDQDFDDGCLPEWIQKMAASKKNVKTIIGVPVSVSTIDFVIAGGDLTQQGNHALAFLRAMTSDLIVDEIDGYDPGPLAAVLRLVMLAGLFKRNVVVSSATLSRPVAKFVWTAYRRGMAMRESLEGKKQPFGTAIIGDTELPLIDIYPTCESFMNGYETFLGKMCESLEGKRFRVPFLQRINGKKISGPIYEAIERLRSTNFIIDPKTGKKISFGLVRIANIKNAVKVARWLAGKSNDRCSYRVCCYHSQLLMLHRWFVEKRLDELLSRKNGDDHIFEDDNIRSIISETKQDDIVFVVVATPVEEIGRDHDFDWAVIEPSSS